MILIKAHNLRFIGAPGTDAGPAAASSMCDTLIDWQTDQKTYSVVVVPPAHTSRVRCAYTVAAVWQGHACNVSNKILRMLSLLIGEHKEFECQKSP